MWVGLETPNICPTVALARFQRSQFLGFTQPGKPDKICRIPYIYNIHIYVYLVSVYMYGVIHLSNISWLLFLTFIHHTFYPNGAPSNSAKCQISDAPFCRREICCNSSPALFPLFLCAWQSDYYLKVWEGVDISWLFYRSRKVCFEKR